ncbi:MAG TPA: hypothetical protein VFI31_19850 [Pirellulales bacterium]|nr:hypothetical protein [Pirellulales bacterium]
MSELLTFDGLLALLPDCPGPDGLPTFGVDRALPRYETSNYSAFMPPNLTKLEAASASSSQVIVLSAPGAVGKSTLARAVSYAKKAPLWNLAEYDRVARDSLVGALGRAFDYRHLSTVLERLAAGTLFVVIDALDEAQLKAGSEASFMDFLEDIGKAAKSTPQVAFVLLGRTGIAEDSWLVLSDQSVQTSLYKIEFFDEAQRIEYLDRRLREDQKTAQSIAARRAEFEEARDLLFSQLGKAIDDDDPQETNAFLGYAPVLDTIAVLFKEEGQNYHALINKLRAEDDAADTTSKLGRIKLIDRVVTDILEREHEQKLVNNLRPVLASQAPADWDEWETLYSPPEQQARLLARLLGDSWVPPSDVPATIQEPYERQLRSFFNEHPFLREAKSAASVVFEAHLFAAALVQPNHPLRNRLVAHIERRQAQPSRLLADFYFFFRARATQPVLLSDVGILYGSYLSGETQSRRLHLELDGGEPGDDEWHDGTPTLEFAWIDPTADDVESAELSCVRSELSIGADDRLTLRGLLKDASITLRSTVCLAPRASEFVVGPRVQVRANRLEMPNTEGLVVRGASHPMQGIPDSQLVALESLSADVGSITKVTSYGVLAVNWPGCRAYPWTPYAVEPAREVEKDPRLAPIYRRFRRVAMAFRSGKKGQLARIKDKIRHLRTLQGELGQALLGDLLVDNVLYEDDKSYFWNHQVANSLIGVSWLDLRRGFTPPKLIAYLRRFADNHNDLL